MPVSRGVLAVGSCLVAAMLSGGPGAHAQAIDGGTLSPDMFEKQPVELAQILRAPVQDSDTEPAAPSSQAAPADEDEGDFVFAGDLARQLRKIDPNAKVDWTGNRLLIKVSGKEFAVFPTGQEMVVNGDVEGNVPPLTFRNDEIYVPQAVITRIGQELERDTLPDDAATTTLTAETPVATPEAEETPGTEVTPATSILPDTGAPPIATPTPRGATPAPSAVLPDVTPSPTPAATPTAAATPEPTVATSVATPFPQATPTPTPTPAPTPTPTPDRSKERTSQEKRDSILSTESFKAALRDRVSVNTQDLALFSLSQLEKMAANRSVTKIVIHPDESGLERQDQYGKESANVSLAIARRLKAHLENEGMSAVLTRESEDAITIGESMETITKSEAHVLVVVSVGYSTSFQDMGGYRVFFMNESVDYHSLNPRSFDASEIVPAELNYKPFQNASKVLASSIKNSVSAALDNREPIGTNPAPHYLVRRAPMAAATVVVGYLSNPSDVKRLTDKEQQDAMARALAEGIQNFANQASQGKTANAAGGK